MGSRLLPLSLALGAFTADAAGFHHIASYLVLLAVVGAAAAAFVGVGEWLEGKGGLVRAGSTTLALVLLLLGSAVRSVAPEGAHVPVFAVSTLVLAGLVYTLPLLAWLVEPVAPKAQPRLRTDP
jgi:hypothetical protein